MRLIVIALLLAGCSRGTAPRAPIPVPKGDGWTYVPERCRDADGKPMPRCRGRVVTSDTSIEILEPVRFIDNTAEIAPESLPMIKAVAGTLLGNPTILVMEIRGHSDSLLHPVVRAEVAQQRAENIAALLIANGVEPSRVTTYGASDSELMFAPDDVRNRRVEFMIMERSE